MKIKGLAAFLLTGGSIVLMVLAATACAPDIAEVSTVRLPERLLVMKTPGLKVTRAEVTWSPVGSEKRGILTIEGQFKLAKGEAKKARVVVTVIHSRAGVLESDSADIEAKKENGMFRIVLGQSRQVDYSHGGYQVLISLEYPGTGEVALRRLEAPDLNQGASRSLKHEVPDSKISWGAGFPMGGKMTINGSGTYDPGKGDGGTTCKITSITMRARHKTTGQLLSNAATFNNGAWAGVLGMVPEGEWDVWAELIVSNPFGELGCTDSATEQKPATVTK